MVLHLIDLPHNLPFMLGHFIFTSEIFCVNHRPLSKSCCRFKTETLYHRDDALLYIAYVMLIWAAPIPADRWPCSLWS